MVKFVCCHKFGRVFKSKATKATTDIPANASAEVLAKPAKPRKLIRRPRRPAHTFNHHFKCIKRRLSKMGASKTLSKDAAVNAMQSTEASVLPEEYCKLDSDKYVFVNKVHTETSTAGNVSNACCTKSRKAFELNEKFNARRSWINSIKAKWIALRHRRKARQAKTSKASKASETSESAAKEISATSTIPDISSESAVPEISTVPVLQEVSEKTE